MLIRIVRMTFRPEEVENFLKIFEASKDKIENFPGCRSVSLHKDYHAENIYATYSIWDDDTSLDGYRHSELFRNVWSETKALFADKPVAFSLEG